jgi:hypothetical protein
VDQKFWHEVRARAVAGVIAGIILAALAALWAWSRGWWPAIWGALTYSIPVPLSVMLALAFIVAIVVVRWIIRQRTPFQPSELQVRVLRVMVQLDRQKVWPHDLSKALLVEKLRIDQAVDGLLRQQLISHAPMLGIPGPGGLVLTSEGRDFVIAAGYVSGAPIE